MNEQLILDNLNLVYLTLKQLDLYNQRDEYYDIGVIGLVKAAKTFDESKGYAFSTYAVTSIRNAILHERRARLTNIRKANINPISLSTVVHGSGKDEILLEDVIASDFNVEDHVIKKEQIAAVKKAITTLSDREKFILKCYMFDNLQQHAIGKMLNVSQTSISRAVSKIIEKIRKQVL